MCGDFPTLLFLETSGPTNRVRGCGNIPPLFLLFECHRKSFFPSPPSLLLLQSIRQATSISLLLASWHHYCTVHGTTSEFGWGNAPPTLLGRQIAEV